MASANQQYPKLRAYFSGLYLLAILVVVVGGAVGGVSPMGLFQRSVGVLIIVWLLKGILTKSWSAWNELGQNADGH